MRLRSALLLASLAAAGVLVQVHAATKLIPVDAFVEPPTYSGPKISPDGKHIAVNVRIKRGDRSIPTMSVYTLPDLQIVSIIALPGFEIPTNFEWLDNSRLAVEKGEEVGLRERPQATGEVVAVNLDGTKQEYLYGYKGYKQSSRGDRYGDDHGWGSIDNIPLSHNGHVLLGTHQWRGNRSQLYDIDSNNSIRKLLADIPRKNVGFLMQNDGKPRFASGADEETTYDVLYRLDDASGEWRQVDNTKLGRVYNPVSFTPDDNAVYAIISAKGEPGALVREDMRTGQRTKLGSDPLGSISEFEFTSRPAVPFAYVAATGIPSAHYIDDNAPDAVLHKTLSKSFPGAYVHFINFSDDGQKLLFQVNSDRDPGSYYLFDRKSGKADLLFANLQQIEPEEMAERRPIHFSARDGLEITGYLTMPKNPGKNKLPMVLLPHGGPFGIHDSWYFDSDSQFLANRGYAVLQVNFRGSGGRGVTYEESGYREWGGKLMNDMIDGVKWAEALPEIDADRVCVYGVSFGGYSALMLPVRAPGMFKCSVGYSGLYNLRGAFTADSVKGETGRVNYLKKTMGVDMALLDTVSPSELAGQIKVPVFLVHGTHDKTTELSQFEMMRDALVKAGQKPEIMLVDNEGHGFYDSEHRKAFYLKLEAFLAQHIGPK